MAQTIVSLGIEFGDIATKATLAVCVGVLATCIALVAFHDRTDPFAAKTVQARQDVTMDAVRDGRCRDAHDGLLAVERLRGRMPSLRRLKQIDTAKIITPGSAATHGLT